LTTTIISPFLRLKRPLSASTIESTTPAIHAKTPTGTLLNSEYVDQSNAVAAAPTVSAAAKIDAASKAPHAVTVPTLPRRLAILLTNVVKSAASTRERIPAASGIRLPPNESE
jgi:hypothetical protein